jgi:Protein  of unknown function (DUF3018)
MEPPECADSGAGIARLNADARGFRLHVTVKGAEMAKSKPRAKSPPKSSRDKVRAWRARMRAKGLKPVTLWLPDVHSEEFKKQAHEESLRIANSPGEKEDMAFIESLIDRDKL